jgi:hypothetical protein
MRPGQTSWRRELLDGANEPRRLNEVSRLAYRGRPSAPRHPLWEFDALPEYLDAGETPEEFINEFPIGQSTSGAGGP